MQRQRFAAIIPSELRAEDDGKKYIEGYFSVFNSRTQLWLGVFEEVDSHAFEDTLSNDIRVLTNHDTTLVLGRNKSGTAELKTDSRGLWARVEVNEKDTDALNIYARVQRGDVNQCSFGFNILEEDYTNLPNGDVVIRLKKVDLHEISICTFPAYADTSVQARMKDLEQHEKRQFGLRKNQILNKLQGEENNAKTT